MPQPMRFTSEILAQLAAVGLAATPEKPLDLLFCAEAVRSQSARVRAHVTNRTLPDGSLIRLTEHILIASPELAFAQVAAGYSFGKLIMAGCELCSTYRILGDHGESLPEPERRPQLTSVAAVRKCLDKFGLTATAKAVRALRYVFDDAASPMEAKTALLLSLPQHWGGYSLPRPVLNARFYLSSEALRLYPCDPCRLDLYWEDCRFDVEYDGGPSHETRAHAEDVARAAALTHDGVDVFVVAKQQVYNSKAFEAVARIIADRLGSTIRIRAADFPAKQRRLRKELNLL